MKLSILIISYNTREMALGCLQSVYEQTKGIEFEVIVVDNASGDGSAASISASFPQVRLIEPGVNLGFAAGNNLGARAARGDYLLLLNPDTVILDGAVQKAVTFASSRPDAGIVGGRTFFNDLSLNPNSCHGRPTMWSMFCKGVGLSSLFRRSRWFDTESLGRWKRDTIREVDAVTGCFLLIRRALWEQLGGFDESFFMYGEETDLCLRARQPGYKCMICPEATIIHYGGASEKVRADKMVKLFVAKARLFQKHWSWGKAWFGVRMLDLWALTRVMGHGVLAAVKPAYRESFETWRKVWRRRGEWRKVGGPLKVTAALNLPDPVTSGVGSV